jgi:hypothetical protein
MDTIFDKKDKLPNQYPSSTTTHFPIPFKTNKFQAFPTKAEIKHKTKSQLVLYK